MNEVVEPGALYIVSTPIGNLDDITLRAIKILSAVDLVAAEDTRKTKFLFDHLSIKKPLVSYHSYNEVRRVPELMEKLRKGSSVAVVTNAGTPGISDPSYSLVCRAIDFGLKVIAIPGPSAILPALIVSGLPTSRFVFEGFLPLKRGRRGKLEELKSERRTIVIYESPFRVVKTLDDIVRYFGDRRVAVVRELTKKFEEVVRGRASEVIEHFRKKKPKGEFVLVVEGSQTVYKSHNNIGASVHFFQR
ncbi:MAG: 16S rRNA (cytidine(1402)-2'-O)-methyltransferase [Ignavibacteria bacterium]|nr:16S rRNA (cytidine(1402)-2'-O)-methyltransferase [Ignavibacteria bacterium]